MDIREDILREYIKAEFKDHKSFGMAKVSKALNIPKKEVEKEVKLLQKDGYLIKGPGNSFVITAKVCYLDIYREEMED